MSATKIEITTKNLNVGDTTARLGFAIAITDDEKDFLSKVKLFCGSRLRITLSLTQATLPGTQGPGPITGIVESKSIGVTTKAITGGLVFALADTNAGELAHFTKQPCTLEVERIGLAESEDEPE